MTPAAIAVLAQEHRWVMAAVHHDRAALASVLAGNFVHIDYRGTISYREDALRAVSRPWPYRESLSEQTVDFPAAGVAVVHGLNAVSQNGHLLVRLRYTDVYAFTAGAWRAVSAQETRII
jgi:hypothetical protein